MKRSRQRVQTCPRWPKAKCEQTLASTTEGWSQFPSMTETLLAFMALPPSKESTAASVWRITRGSGAPAVIVLVAPGGRVTVNPERRTGSVVDHATPQTAEQPATAGVIDLKPVPPPLDPAAPLLSVCDLVRVSQSGQRDEATHQGKVFPIHASTSSLKPRLLPQKGVRPHYGEAAIEGRPERVESRRRADSEYRR